MRNPTTARSPFRSPQVLEARTTGLLCPSIRPPVWYTCRRRRAEASTTPPTLISTIKKAARTWVSPSVDLGEAGRLPLVMLPTRPLRLRWLLLNRYRLLRRSDLHHLKAMVVEAFYSRGISR